MRRKSTLAFGNLFKTRRREDGKTLAKMAESTGLSFGYLSDLERDNCNISLEKLRKCVLAYGLSEEEREELRKTIIPMVGENLECFTENKEVVLFHRLASLSKEACERIIAAIAKYNLLRESKNQEAMN